MSHRTQQDTQSPDSDLFSHSTLIDLQNPKSGMQASAAQERSAEMIQWRSDEIAAQRAAQLAHQRTAQLAQQRSTQVAQQRSVPTPMGQSQVTQQVANIDTPPGKASVMLSGSPTTSQDSISQQQRMSRTASQIAKSPQMAISTTPTGLRPKEAYPFGARSANVSQQKSKSSRRQYSTTSPMGVQSAPTSLQAVERMSKKSQKSPKPSGLVMNTTLPSYSPDVATGNVTSALHGGSAIRKAAYPSNLMGGYLSAGISKSPSYAAADLPSPIFPNIYPTLPLTSPPSTPHTLISNPPYTSPYPSQSSPPYTSPSATPFSSPSSPPYAPPSPSSPPYAYPSPASPQYASPSAPPATLATPYPPRKSPSYDVRPSAVRKSPSKVRAPSKSSPYYRNYFGPPSLTPNLLSKVKCSDGSTPRASDTGFSTRVYCKGEECKTDVQYHACIQCGGKMKCAVMEGEIAKSAICQDCDVSGQMERPRSPGLMERPMSPGLVERPMSPGLMERPRSPGRADRHTSRPWSPGRANRPSQLKRPQRLS